MDLFSNAHEQRIRSEAPVWCKYSIQLDLAGLEPATSPVR
jgi:hypothetical protein